MIKKGLKVLVLAGKDKKKEGEVIELDRRNNRAKVKEVNMVKKHIKPSAQNPQGGIIEKEAPIQVSNLSLLNSKGEATRIGYKIEDGKKVRFTKKLNEII